MAKKVAGETTLKVGARSVRLRLEIGAQMDLEDYFGSGLIRVAIERLPQLKLRDLTVAYVGMTGGEISDTEQFEKGAADVRKAGMMQTLEALQTCIQNTLVSDEEGKEAGPAPKK